MTGVITRRAVTTPGMRLEVVTLKATWLAALISMPAANSFSARPLQEGPVAIA